MESSWPVGYVGEGGVRRVAGLLVMWGTTLPTTKIIHIRSKIITIWYSPWGVPKVFPFISYCPALQAGL